MASDEMREHVCHAVLRPGQAPGLILADCASPPPKHTQDVASHRGPWPSWLWLAQGSVEYSGLRGKGKQAEDFDAALATDTGEGQGGRGGRVVQSCMR